MRYSGLYFIPIHGATQDLSAHTLSALINGIETHFEFATRQAPWSLSYRLLRSVAAPNAPPQPQSYQNILHISYLSSQKTYCYIHPSIPSVAIKPDPASLNPPIKGEPTSQAGTPQPSHLTPTTPSYGTIISIPYNQSESHFGYLAAQLSPLWAFRNSLSIPKGQGITYRAGQYLLHIGEIRMARQGPSSTTNPVSPGVVVCITTIGGNNNSNEDGPDSGYTPLESNAGNDDNGDDADLEGVEAGIRAVWNSIKTGIDFGKSEVKEVMMGKDGLHGGGEKEATVRMWCEVLRLRG